MSAGIGSTGSYGNDYTVRKITWYKCPGIVPFQASGGECHKSHFSVDTGLVTKLECACVSLVLAPCTIVPLLPSSISGTLQLNTPWVDSPWFPNISKLGNGENEKGRLLLLPLFL